MSLAELIRRKKSPAAIATAISATPATPGPESTGTVARIAIVAIAKPPQEQTAAAITSEQEAAILAWLAQIGEDDEAIIDEVLTKCRHDSETRAYYLGRARYAVADDLDDRRFCMQCENLRSGVCSVAKPGGAVSAPRGYRAAPDILHRCAGYSPTTNCLTRAT